jgi:hypothetical protein
MGKRQIQPSSPFYAVILRLVLTACFKTFIVAARKATEFRASARNIDPKNQFTLKELDWFSQNAYNCAVDECEHWEDKHIISIAESCLKV